MMAVEGWLELGGTPGVQGLWWLPGTREGQEEVQDSL